MQLADRGVATQGFKGSWRVQRFFIAAVILEFWGEPFRRFNVIRALVGLEAAATVARGRCALLRVGCRVELGLLVTRPPCLVLRRLVDGDRVAAIRNIAEETGTIIFRPLRLLLLLKQAPRLPGRESRRALLLGDELTVLEE